MNDYEFTGKTVDEAVDEGLKTLGLARDEAEIQVLDEGKKGGLFTKGVKARVRISRKKTDGERAVEFLDGMFELLGITATTELEEGNENENTKINVVTPNTYALIGHRGEMLDALQVLAGAVANTGREEYKRVVVDCEGYREKREETLKRLANKLAEKAVRLGRKLSLEPMTPYERRIIHAALADSTEVKTASEGKEPNRYIVVIPNNLRPGAERYERRSGFNRDRRPYSRDKREKPYNRDRNASYDREKREDRPYGERREDRYGDREKRGGYRDRREDRPRASGLPRSKRQPYFGTFLGNSNDMKNAEAETKAPESKDEE
ncbi:MAG TPA: Jag N-terminal domain-containing protein [Candidatus Borkfalkia excrementipullorum]|nr:Jag N-terminal domain-containing protein [Candidatus Borkfalkia excrementipullorum]